MSSFQNGLNDLFSSTGFYFESKVIEGSHKEKNMFFNFWALLKMGIFEFDNFSHLVAVRISKIQVSIFPLNYQNAYGDMLIRSLIHKHA